MDTTIENTQEQTKSKRLTLQDVKDVIAANELDPMTVGPTKIRQITGSGSLTTISNYLSEIRQEIHNKNALQSNADTTPPIPSDLGQQIYNLAYQHAFNQVFKAFGGISSENQALKANAIAIKNELAEVLEFSDAQAEQNEALRADFEGLRASIDQVYQEHAKALENATKTHENETEALREQLRGLESTIKDTLHAHQIENMEAAAKIKALTDLHKEAAAKANDLEEKYNDLKRALNSRSKKPAPVDKTIDG